MRVSCFGIRMGLPLLVLSVFLQACHNEQLPKGAQLSIVPDSREIRVTETYDEQGRCIVYPDNHVDLPVVLTLNTSEQAPIGGADITVYADFAENTYGGYPALKLYRDRNGNGVIDGDAEYISGIDDPVAVVRTGQYTGQQSLLLRVNLSCQFRGEVFAFSGQATASSSVSVSADDTRQRQ